MFLLEQRECAAIRITGGMKGDESSIFEPTLALDQNGESWWTMALWPGPIASRMKVIHFDSSCF